MTHHFSSMSTLMASTTFVQKYCIFFRSTTIIIIDTTYCILIEEYAVSLCLQCAAVGQGGGQQEVGSVLPRDAARVKKCEQGTLNTEILAEKQIQIRCLSL